MIPTDFVPAIGLIACAAASLVFVLWRGRRTPPAAGGNAAAGPVNRENPAGRQENPAADRPQPPQKPDVSAGPPMPARFTRAAASWRGFAGAVAGAVLYGLIRGLARNGFRPPEDMSSLVPMLGYLTVCTACILYGLLVWRPRHMARRAEQEAAVNPLDFAVRPSLLPLGVMAVGGSLCTAAVCLAAWWHNPAQLPFVAAVLGGIVAGMCLLFGALGCLPALRVRGNTGTLRSWDLRRRSFALADIARCQLSCFSWKNCPQRNQSAAALAALPRGQRPLCFRGNIRLTFYAADGRRLCRFYGDARNLSVLLGRLRGSCRFETKPCIPIRPDGQADAAAEN